MRFHSHALLFTAGPTLSKHSSQNCYLKQEARCPQSCRVTAPLWLQKKSDVNQYTQKQGWKGGMPTTTHYCMITITTVTRPSISRI